ncbi:hypothetical protein [Nocardioides alpinus]|uniref:hypothetical protein n=1 Tax=Nocardioides alpinus TaxID=748909 RepID=UPI001113A8F6|nr:hypothetical protein [Nocardioides alpinus]
MVQAARKIAMPAAAVPPPTSAKNTTLAKKLRRGKVVPTAETAASRARMGWTAFEATFSEPLPVAGQLSAFEALRSRVVLEATDAQVGASKHGQPYGNAMYEDIRARMGALAAERSSLDALTPQLLMGLVYDLTAHCEIWWSERFDVDALDSSSHQGDVAGGES